MEWSHAVAPGANILLVEANSNSDSDLMHGRQLCPPCRRRGRRVDELGRRRVRPAETADDSYFTTPSGHAGVTFLASSGDERAPPIYPAASPNVVSVGGTSLYLTAQNNWSSESGWSGSGGGISCLRSRSRPIRRAWSRSRTTYRTNPDVSYDADPNTGFPVYDSLNNPASTPWGQWGGTSDASPQWAALVAIADQGRALDGKTSLDGPTQTLPALYSLPAADFHDITTGTSTGSPELLGRPGLRPGHRPRHALRQPHHSALAGPSGVSTTLTVSTSSPLITYGQSATFMAIVTAASGSTAPTAGNVDFFDTTACHDLGQGTLGSSAGTTSTWALTTGVKSFNATAGDTITATYTPTAGVLPAAAAP